MHAVVTEAGRVVQREHIAMALLTGLLGQVGGLKRRGDIASVMPPGVVASHDWAMNYRGSKTPPRAAP